MWAALYRSSMIKYATQRINKRFYSMPLHLIFLKKASEISKNTNRSLIQTLLNLTPSSSVAFSIFQCYIACCLYTDGLDFLLNMKDLNSLHKIKSLTEHFEINEVSLNSLYIAKLMHDIDKMEKIHDKVEKYKYIESICGSEINEDISNIEDIIISVLCIRKYLFTAFETLSYKLQHPVYVYTGVDAPDDEEVNVTDSIFISSTTSHAVAKKFSSAGSMGMMTGGHIFRIKLEKNTPLLSLTSSLFTYKLVKKNCISTTSPLQENEILLMSNTIIQSNVESCSDENSINCI